MLQAASTSPQTESQTIEEKLLKPIFGLVFGAVGGPRSGFLRNIFFECFHLCFADTIAPKAKCIWFNSCVPELIVFWSDFWVPKILPEGS